MSTTIAIEGMVCSGCVNSVTKALKSAPGVTKVDVQLKPGKAVIEHDPSKIKPEELVRVVNETGYTARLGEPAAASGAAGSAPAK